MNGGTVRKKKRRKWALSPQRMSVGALHVGAVERQVQEQRGAR